MVAFFQLLVVMSVLSVSTTHDKIRIREGGWKKFSSFEYKVYSSWEKFNFVEAEAYCRNRSAHLVSIHSDEESEFVNIWIGLVHDDMGRLMAWTDGSPFDYVRWSYGHPVSEDSDAAAFNRWAYPDVKLPLVDARPPGHRGCRQLCPPGRFAGEMEEDHRGFRNTR
ncbi:lectin C-type domain protein [Ancylostoma ceylanicum]|uniref:Lectin C-type domain protein n=1 Tax=Ancylostoma ceylanicum TaxID=53326 RepID=A0A0D6LII4_9BILA|nr:lectin C-type domain protein [Ancylostoma ceylanicum]